MSFSPKLTTIGIHVECWEEAIERCNVACKGLPSAQETRCLNGENMCQRGDLWIVGNTILKDVVSLPFLAVTSTLVLAESLRNRNWPRYLGLDHVEPLTYEGVEFIDL
jgi:hypothetical protein